MTWTLHTGDAVTELRKLAAESVHCVVTSPPYWGLRDYGTASWEGGDAECDHTSGAFRGDEGQRTWDGGPVHGGVKYYPDTCRKCGARRIDQQLGLEPTPEEYVARMVEVFREVKRVLRKDGTCWVNMGDGYASSGRGDCYGWTNGKASKRDQATKAAYRTVAAPPNLKTKDLIGQPWRLAFALQADGWYLRSDVIWSKPNPMPESVTDRPTKAHEHIFLLSKSPRYFFDTDAVREKHAEPWRSGKHESSTPHSGRLDGGEQAAFTVGRREYNPAGRNIRDVWTIATAPFPDAHFATFPPELPARCIKAGTSLHGVCADCGAPWERVVESPDQIRRAAVVGAPERRDRDRPKGQDLAQRPAPTTTGWRPTCTCDAATVPATVLDPFAGAGTTLMVARRLGRHAIGIELNPDYAAMARKRIRGDMPLFNVETGT